MNHAEARSPRAAARPAPRESCDAPEGRADATARRDDAFAALAAAAHIDFGPVYTGDWTGRWSSRMPMARLFFVLESGREPGFLADADARIPLLRNTWVFLPPGATVAAVAARFGFGNEFYFSRFFRRHHGLSPSQWRRQCHV